MQLLVLADYGIIHTDLNSSVSYTTITREGVKRKVKFDGALFTSVGMELLSVVDETERSENF